jgi:hypothetical protein
LHRFRASLNADRQRGGAALHVKAASRPRLSASQSRFSCYCCRKLRHAGGFGKNLRNLWNLWFLETRVSFRQA